MFEVVKRALFTGVGLASLTREKIEELGKDLSRHAELSEAEAAKFQVELEGRAADAQRELREQIDRRTQQVVQGLGLARADDFAALSARVAALSARVEALEGRPDAPVGASDQG